jgi:hypothetical protein
MDNKTKAALELIARCPDGVTSFRLAQLGYEFPTIARLAQARMVRAHLSRSPGGSDIVRLWINDAGLAALKGAR